MTLNQPEFKQIYGGEFYQGQSSGSRTSAEVILPLVLAQVPSVASLIDVGGGVGTWAAVARELGVPTVKLADGPWAREAGLQVPSEDFVAVDLEADSLGDLGRFDLVLCLETAEHLSPARGESFIDDLCGLADAIYFSAALPGQGGTHHINERWLSYWQGLFAARGFGMADPIRPKVWRDPRVERWYAQNGVLFSRGISTDYAGLVDVVHPDAFVEAKRMSAPPLTLTAKAKRKLKTAANKARARISSS